MRANLLRLLGLAAALFLVLPLRAQDPPKEAPKDDTLPKGAKVRLGNAPIGVRFAPAFTLLPPDYKTILIPESRGSLRRIDLATGRPLDKAGAEALTGAPAV